MSNELDNLLLSTLSTGPVGVGDRIGSVNRENLLRAVRADGVIVKPDVPLDKNIATKLRIRDRSMTRLRVRCLTLVISTQRISISVTQLQEEDQEKQKMKILPLYAAVIALGLVPMSILSGDRHHNSPTANGNVAQITDGAFRDGLYLGRLAAESGSEPHVAIGRWATAEDRSSFTAGYYRGYSELLASRAEVDNRVRQAK